MKKIELVKMIFFNKRLDKYKYYLDLAKINGYRICTMKDFYNNLTLNEKMFVLRHDVDHSGDYVKKCLRWKKKVV